VTFVAEALTAEMSVTKTKERWFRIYSADRKLRKAVGANTLEELITGGIKLNVLHAAVIYWYYQCLE